MAAARAALLAHWGYAGFRPMQARVLGPLLAGRDVLAVLPTGAGKSLCYQVPALLVPGLTLVVSPLIALMQDQVAALRRRGIAAAYLTSTLTAEQRSAVLHAAIAGDVRLLYSSPERLAALAARLRGVPIALLAVDEAHCIVEWGNAFRPAYRQLGRFRYLLGRPPTVALTGSATPAARREIIAELGIHQAHVVLGSFDRPNLRFVVGRVPDDRDRFARIRAMVRGAAGATLIYTPTRRLTELVTRALLRRSHRAAPYHAALTAAVRRRVLDGFLRDDVRTVVATTAFGMGIDKPDVPVSRCDITSRSLVCL
jgi:ATP-dependent DNA helicase RecQ